MLSPKQIDVIREPLHEYNILSGVTGSAKSFISNVKWYETILTAPNNSKFIQSGNTEESLFDNITSPLLEMDEGVDLDYLGVANKKRLIVKKTGTQVICTGANTENAQNRIQGKSIRGWYADEIVKQSPSFVDMAITRCRYIENNKIVMGFKLWTCNPDHAYHPIKVNYIDNKEIDVKNWFFGFYDNPTMTAEYIEGLRRSVHGVFADRMIKGIWCVAEGIIYENFNRSEQVISSFPSERIVEYQVWNDWGYENPMGMLLVGKTSDNQYIILDEFYKKHVTIDEGFKLPVGWDNISLGYGDPARPDFIYQFTKYTGINCVPAHNDVIEGIVEVQKYMQKRDNGEYGLYIMDKCVNLLSELDNYRWKESRTGITKDEPIKENDHLMDCMRYGIYTQRQNIDFSALPRVTGHSRKDIA